jgi:hypothetical protein
VIERHIGLTAWPENAGSGNAGSEHQDAAAAPVRSRLALMGELEASLHRSRKALLALDLAGIERATGEQVGMIREFQACLPRGVLPLAIGNTGAKGAPGLVAHAPELEELRKSESRVLEAVRLQAALLGRAQCKLHVLANMLAGPSVTYGPWLARNGGLPRGFHSK